MRSLGSARLGLDRRPARESDRAVLGQQAADRVLGLVVVALAEVDVADLAARVDQVLGRPVLVAEGVPGAVVVVLDDRVGEPVLLDRVGDVARVALERELRRVDADDDQPVALVRSYQDSTLGQGADAVDAGVGPEVDQHRLALGGQLRDRDGLAVGGVEELPGSR